MEANQGHIYGHNKVVKAWGRGVGAVCVCVWGGHWGEKKRKGTFVILSTIKKEKRHCFINLSLGEYLHFQGNTVLKTFQNDDSSDCIIFIYIIINNIPII